jgi:integrase
MIKKKPFKAPPVKEEMIFDDGGESELMQAGLNEKSAAKVQQVAKGFSKADSRFWMQPGRMKQRNGSTNYSFQVQFKKRRLTFTTRTGNKEASAKIAAGIYRDLLAYGIEETVAKHRPEGVDRSEGGEMSVARVGEWIEGARKVSGANASTFNCYACSLRKIVGDILAVKRTKKRFGPKRGGALDYRMMIDAASLDVLSQAAVQTWRLAYVKRAKNPAQERSRMTSCNSTIRQARSLFAAKVVKYVTDLRQPEPPPFHEVEFYPRQSAKYFSKIDPRKLLQEAKDSLADSDVPAFLAMLLALSAGLRRGEIDSLCWHQIDFNRQLIRVESTDKASLKTADSRAEVPIDENVVAILRGFHAKAEGEFVVEAAGGQGGQKKWGQHYRADAVFTRLTDWLRSKGVDARKPLHELRKELGALVTAEHGIYAASRVLRHADVSTTARHYSDLKTRPVVNVGAWLLEENVARMEDPNEKGDKKAAAEA